MFAVAAGAGWLRAAAALSIDVVVAACCWYVHSLALTFMNDKFIVSC